MIAVAMIFALRAFAIPPNSHDLAVVLRATRLAMGAAAWPQDGTLGVTGRKTRDGLTGVYRETDDLRTGRFRRDVAYALFTEAEGADAGGRWRRDGSGAVHALDSPEADAVVKTERYLARRGFLHDEAGVAVRLLPSEPGDDYVKIEATPASGRTATLRIRRTDALVERITLALSPHIEELRLSEYRRVGSMRLPFRIVTEYGDEAQSGTVDVAGYVVSRRIAASAFTRPRSIDDVTFAPGTTSTTIPARVDAMSNFLIVDASLDGSSPAPFVLDTGGHDIITPREARRWHLTLAGAGQSFGAGSGSSPTRFTRVRSVLFGNARIGPQPFAVLDLDLGRATDARGRSVPIAGILGLEIFERFAVTIARNAVTFSRDVDARACRAVPLRFTSDMPLATARLDGVAGTFGLDTGNNVEPIVFARFLRENALGARTSTPGEPASGSSVGGTLTLTPGRIATLQLGDIRFKDLSIDVSSMQTGSLSTRSEAGNLGLSLIRKLGRVTFDYRNHRLCVELHG